jgi:hypothetical protein
LGKRSSDFFTTASIWGPDLHTFASAVFAPIPPDLKDHDRNDSAEGAEGGEQKKSIERSQ